MYILHFYKRSILLYIIRVTEQRRLAVMIKGAQLRLFLVMEFFLYYYPIRKFEESETGSLLQQPLFQNLVEIEKYYTVYQEERDCLFRENLFSSYPHIYEETPGTML